MATGITFVLIKIPKFESLLYQKKNLIISPHDKV